MKQLTLIVILSAWAVMGACQTNTKKAGSISETIAVAQYEAKMKSLKEMQLVDVRTPGEYSEGHLKGALNMDINGENFAAAVAKLDKNIPVMVYCRSGGRSARAARQLEEMGFKEIYDMDGGITEWKGAGKPVEQ